MSARNRLFNRLQVEQLEDRSLPSGGIPAPPGLVGWWAGDGNAADLVGANPGTLQNGTTFATGYVDQGFALDGVDDIVSIPNSTTINLTADLTIEAWIDPSSATRGIILSKGAGNDYTNAYQLRYGDGNDQRLMLVVADSGTGASYYLSAPGVVPAGVFTHVAATVQGTTGHLYVNGAEVSGLYQHGSGGRVTPASSLTTHRFSDGGALTIGGRVDTELPFAGVLDEVSLYNRSLSTAEIQAIYNAGHDGKNKPSDIEMQSASLQSGNTVQFTYATTGNPGPFQVAMYTSADGVNYNPADIVATTPVTPNPAGGTGTGTLTIPSPWNSDPAKPYFVVVADPDDLITETNPNNNTTCLPDIAVRDARWVPLSDHRLDVSIIRFEYLSKEYAGSLSLRLVQSSDEALSDDDVTLASQVVAVMPGQQTIGSFRLDRGPSPAVSPRFLLIIADPQPGFAELNQANNRVSLSVSNPQPLSSELQADAPLANTREDRVELWLRRYRSLITSTASRFRIAPQAIAGAIAWEALHNVKNTLLGPGKVHPIEFNGPSNAETVERLGYLPAVSDFERLRILRTPEGAINYIGAIMGAFADLSERAGSQANLRSRPEILTTLYNGISRGNTDIRLHNALGYFRQKVMQGDTYEPGPTMGVWVEGNLPYLTRSLLI